ncbi:MAG TPA: ATP-binding protein [Thermoanaerobaculaceae bacterium]|nr:ATP-binding protein [Thermoanaerobaculaceae bacterium]
MSRRRTPGVAVGFVTFALGLIGLLLTQALSLSAGRAEATERLRAAVEALAPNAAGLFQLTSEQADEEIRRWAAASGLRVTLISPDGVVHADSWTLPTLLGRLENHINRPEVQAARTHTVGSSRRRSVTTDRPTAYVARLIGPVEKPVGFLRLAREDELLRWPASEILVVLVVALVAGVLADRWDRRTYGSTVRHLAAWTELPVNSDLEAIADDADRRFRAVREEFTRELDATRAALEQVSEGVILLDRDGVVRYANRAAGALLGAPLGPGRALVEAVRAPEVLGIVSEVLHHGGTHHTGVSVPDGPELAVRAAAVVHPVLAAALVLSDVRGERQLERARRALVADLAHELRTPLTVLSGLAEELTDLKADAALTTTMSRQVQRLRAFAEELEELTRIESGQLKLHVSDADATAVARQVVADLQSAAAKRAVAVAVVGGSTPLRTDPTRLAQVLTNLLDNAIRYNRPDGQVTVRVGSEDGKVRLEVEDTGVGIPAGEVELVFQRFYRVRRQAEAEGGSGLGLAIVKHLVSALGGTVSLASNEGKGTTVTLLLPGLS